MSVDYLRLQRTRTPASTSNWNRCICYKLSGEQRRIQVLEAESELRRLRDRVRKALSKQSTPDDRRRKRARLITGPVAEPTERMAGPRLELRWEVTAQQLVECLCFWRHGTALGRVGMTDRLKELTPRRTGAAEPPASKRQLTLVWWQTVTVIGWQLGADVP